MNRAFKEKAAVILYLKFLLPLLFTFDIMELFSSLGNSEVQNDSTKQLWMFLADIKVHFQKLIF